MTPPNFKIRYANKQELLKDNLKTLTERERELVTLRYGIPSGPKMTLEEVGKRMGVTKQRVHQMEEGAIRKVLNRMKKHG